MAKAGFEQQVLRVDIRPDSELDRTVHVRAVVDTDEMPMPLAVEILFLKNQAGPAVLDGLSQALAGSDIDYSFDEENDAFYLVLRKGRSYNQAAYDAALDLDKGGQVLRITVDMREMKTGH